MSRQTIQIGPHTLGPGHIPAFWPDIDVYFKSEQSQAFHLIDMIAQAGGQYLKGAVLHRADLCLNSDRDVSYYDKYNGTIVHESYKDVIMRHVVPLDVLYKIMLHATNAGLTLVLSVYDHDGVAFAQEIGACAVKIPSSNITHRALIEEVASCGLPMIIDTGRSRFAEIERAVAWIRHHGAGQRLIIQHSPPGPPAPSNRFHMRMIEYLAQTFSCLTGLSDHHPGLEMFPIAIALGACVVEKGLVMDGAQTDIDVAHALPAGKIHEAMTTIEQSWQALGQARRPDDEVPDCAIDRMCIIARRNIAAGEVISRDMLDFAFPPVGIGAEYVDDIIGATVHQDILSGTPLNRDAIDLYPRDL